MTTLEFGIERRKEGQVSRYGRGGFSAPGIPGAKIVRVPKTPKELAAWKLNQALSKYTKFSMEARQEYQGEFANMPNLRTLNMKVLAAAITLLSDIKEPTPESFKDRNILPYIDPLLPAKQLNESEHKRLIVKYKEMILIYITAIQNYRRDMSNIF